MAGAHVKFDKSLTLLIAEPISDSLKVRWVELLRTALRAAYTRFNYEYANQMIEFAPNENWAWSSAEWFKGLGLDVSVRKTETGTTELVVCGVVNRKHQETAFKECLEKPFEIVKSPYRLTAKPKNDKWFDDIEIENRSHSIRTLQGGGISRR
jgi:hypothetical protein